MKWLRTKTHQPPCDGYYIVRSICNDEESDDIWFGGCYWETGKWLSDDTITHFIVPDAIEW